MCLLMSVEYKRFSGVWDNLNKKFLLGTYNDLKTPTTTYGVLCGYKNITPPRPQAPPSAVALLQSNVPNSTAVTGSYGCLFTDIIFYRCQEMGHYAVNYLSSTSNTRVVLQYIQVVLTMVQTKNNTPEHDIINPN